jgi:predicted amidohydrolase
VNTDTLNVAAAQFPMDAPATFDAWAEKVSSCVKKGAATGAALLVFPEYGAIELASICGDTTRSDLALTLAAVADLAERASAVWSTLAKAHGVYILAPSGPERRNDRFVNAARLFGPRGGMGIQEKLILTPFERDWGMSRGHGQRVFDTALGKIGVAICYDSEFPLLVRALTEAGAEILLVPSCTEHPSGYNRVRTAALARALESQVVAVMSPTVSDVPWSPVVDRNCGAAGIFVPADVTLSLTGVIAEGELYESGWVSGEVDLARLRQLRETGEMRNWRDWSLQSGAAPLSGSVEIVAVA